MPANVDLARAECLSIVCDRTEQRRLGNMPYFRFKLRNQHAPVINGGKPEVGAQHGAKGVAHIFGDGTGAGFNSV